MPVIARIAVPASALALGEVLESLPDAEFEVERIVETGEDRVMPLLWVRDAEQEEIEDVLEEASSVQNASLVAAFDEEFLYQMDWIDRIDLLVQMITNSKASILDAYGQRGRWHLRVLYPDRQLFSKTHDFCEEHGMDLQIQSIREMEGEPAGRYGLTEEQHQALVYAVKRGYFKIPRDITLEELATETDVSHQALSERLRRGMETLVEDTLMIGTMEEEGIPSGEP
jgi:predicted DNA binding protein